MPIELGNRVAYILSDQARMGVVTELNSSNAIIKLDNDQSIPVNPERLKLVNYWKNRNKEKLVEELKFYNINKSALEIFASKQAIIFGPAAMRAMWYWANHNVFNNKLKEPELIAANTKSKYGRYRLQRGKNLGHITASAINHNIRELFATMLHEMVHQYNFEIDWRQLNEFNPTTEGSHGQVFLKWLPIILAKTGMQITITGSTMVDDATIYGESDEPTTKAFIFVLIKPRDNWLGFVVKDEADLEVITGEMGSLLRRIDATDSRVYAGRSNLARVKNEFPKAGLNGRINLNTVKRSPTPSVVKLAADTAEAIDGWTLPKI